MACDVTGRVAGDIRGDLRGDRRNRALITVVAAVVALLGVRIPCRADGEALAVLPWRMQHATAATIKYAQASLPPMFATGHVVVVPADRTLDAWKFVTGADWDANSKQAPTREQLLAVGTALHADFVFAGQAVWHSKTIWIGLGRKLKSDCTIDAMMLDVKTGRSTLEAKAVRMDDTAKEDTAGALGNALLGGRVMFNLSGAASRTPHEERAFTLALALSFAPWIRDRNSGRPIPPSAH